jgi:16S rRNA (adenine1518-N6/adenine1519-N6)-dimethyltransferase
MSPRGAAPVQPTLRRLQRFGVRPDRELGQNFLIDSNILGVIGREAELQPGDTVLEVGGGLGVLSEYLAERVAHLHVVEVDERLGEALGDALAGHTNVSLRWADAMRLDLTTLDPPPNKLVANLPYGIAAGFVLRSLQELPSAGLWVVMAQREVGERLAAVPGTGAYGLPSVLAQLAAEVRVVRTIPRSVFYPVPSVDSVLLRLERRGAAGQAAGASGSERGPEPQPQALRALVAAGFAHRRKTLVGSLRLGGWEREPVQQALESLGLASDVRAERLSPQQFLELARVLER